MSAISARPALFLLLALAAAACGPLPQPFQSTASEKSQNALLELPQGRGVYVLGVDGRKGPPALAAAAELRNLGLPASVRLENAGSYALAGFSDLQDRPGPSEEVEIQWVLSAPDGRILENSTQSLLLPDGLWRTGDAAALGAYLGDSMQKIAAIIVPDEPAAQTDLPGFPGARLAVTRIVAPGDGPESLAAALEGALAANGLPVARQASDGDLRIEGEVVVMPQGQGLERVAITWTVRHPQEGDPIGTIRQQNSVPAGLFSGRWGGNARIIAEAAVPGLVDLLDEAARLRGS